MFEMTKPSHFPTKLIVFFRPPGITQDEKSGAATSYLPRAIANIQPVPQRPRS